MKKNCIILLILIISSASAKKNNAYVGEIPDSKYLNVDDFVNRNFFGGETVKIRTKGFASIDNRGKADAISRALDSAQRNAVEETVGTLIESDTLVQNNVLIRDEVYEKTYGYIESYKVLEIKEIDNVMYAEIEAFVGVDMIEDNLMGMGILLGRMNMPRIAVLVTDTNGNLNYAFNTELEKNMSKKGFTFVDAETLENVIKKEQIDYKDILNSTPSKLIDMISVGTKAQIAIIGNADASFFMQIEGTQMKSYRTDIKIKVINMSDATTIAQATHQTGAVGGTDADAYSMALVKSAKVVSGDITKQITKKWQENLQMGSEYNLFIVGLEFEDALKFEKELPMYISKIKSVYNKGFNADSSTFLIKYIGSARDLALDLNDKVKNMGYEINIKSFNEKTIHVNIKKIK